MLEATERVCVTLTRTTLWLGDWARAQGGVWCSSNETMDVQGSSMPVVRLFSSEIVPRACLGTSLMKFQRWGVRDSSRTYVA